MKPLIPLMKNAFLNEKETKKELAEFITKADKLSMGKKCSEFEKKFSRWQGSKNAILFNSGGSANLALLQALKNLGRLKKDDVIGFSALTWATNVMPIIQLGLKPIAIDCEPTTLNVMSQQLESAIKISPLRAFFITNALGFAGDLNEIKNICRKNNIILLEDNCEALGTELTTGKTGNFGLASTFSFFVAHHMSTIEGGMICTNDDKLADMLIIVRANGWDRNLDSDKQKKWRKKHNVEDEFSSKYTFYDLGFNFRPTEITGFLGLSQLKLVDDNIKIRERNHGLFDKIMQKNPDLLPLDQSHIKTLSSFGLPIVCKTPTLKKQYLDRFTKAGIESRPLIAGNIYRQPFYKKYVGKKNPVELTGAHFLHHNGFYCGNYPELTPKDIKIISNCLNKI
jgi:CDP-6-deoxy-D-xylo-4-hexulose-3-dehydrase